MTDRRIGVPKAPSFLGRPTPPSRKDALDKPITEGRAAELIVAGIAVGSKNVFDALAKANAEMFEQLEEIAVQRVLTELEARSLRGRLRRWLRRLRRRTPDLILHQIDEQLRKGWDFSNAQVMRPPDDELLRRAGETERLVREACERHDVKFEAADAELGQILARKQKQDPTAGLTAEEIERAVSNLGSR